MEKSYLARMNKQFWLKFQAEPTLFETFKLTLVVSPKKLSVVPGSPKSQVLPIKMKYLIVLAVLFFVQNVTAVEVEKGRDGKFCKNIYLITFLNCSTVLTSEIRNSEY